MDIKLSKAQLYKIIQLCGFLGASLGKFTGSLMKVDVKKFLEPLATMVAASATDGATHRKIRGGGVVRAGKAIPSVISNEIWMILLEA